MFHHRIKPELRSFLGKYPEVFLPFYRLMGRHGCQVVDKQTDIVIEGYPRSANTFAVAAFSLAQRQSVRIAHHLHVPAQIIQAVKWNIPTLVLIRNPEDAVLSRIVRRSSLSLGFALRDYIRFYENIRRYGKGFVLATFEESIHDFGEVTARINDHFGCNFYVFEHTPRNVDRVFREVERMDLLDTGQDRIDEDTVARPSEKRDYVKLQLSEDLMFYKDLLGDALLLYSEFLNDFSLKSLKG